ncbi:HugZ family protein [Chitinibacter tainanensis]|uniref:HugZ family pyridoxamine 5'-phosphate oxidase n=1 Tax=Chitinibacter tainanensis TaxID=230667 RepID=UPI00235420FB|nr:pyridoxamine 5'-phosphate oxidase family protein [Chitinibacter tainanensis]
MSESAPDLLPDLLQLLRQSRHGSLGTHSHAMPGYPHVSWLPLVPAPNGMPIVVISELAEHTQNVRHHPAVSFLLHEGEMALSKARATVLGQLRPLAAEPLVLARLKRYAPGLVKYLALGDFALWQLEFVRARYIAGFGKMGWVEAADWARHYVLPLEAEATLLQDFAAHCPAETELVGIDAQGLDLRRGDTLMRYPFAQAGQDLAAVTQQLQFLLQGLAKQ